MNKPVVFVTGWNPTRGKGGGSAYVHAHMRAALRAGYDPHLFCLDAASGTSAESFGTVHQLVPALPFRRALEAMQAGAAIVASNVDGIPEDCSDGESTLLVPPGDANALSRALERVLGDAELRRRLGRAARAGFAARFSPDAFAGAIGAVYAELGAEKE